MVIAFNCINTNISSIVVISTKMGFAPLCIIELTVEQNVIPVVITSSLAFRLQLNKLKCKAEVAEDTAIAF